jgi:hypothetical protein
MGRVEGGGGVKDVRGMSTPPAFERPPVQFVRVSMPSVLSQPMTARARGDFSEGKTAEKPQI